MGCACGAQRLAEEVVLRIAQPLPHPLRRKVGARKKRVAAYAGGDWWHEAGGEQRRSQQADIERVRALSENR
jgi:hypothetical protein